LGKGRWAGKGPEEWEDLLFLFLILIPLLYQALSGLLRLGDGERARNKLPEALVAYTRAEEEFHRQDTDKDEEPSIIVKKIVETELSSISRLKRKRGGFRDKSRRSIPGN